MPLSMWPFFFFFFLTAQTENEYSVLICEMGADNTALETKFKI